MAFSGRSSSHIILTLASPYITVCDINCRSVSNVFPRERQYSGVSREFLHREDGIIERVEAVIPHPLSGILQQVVSLDIPGVRVVSSLFDRLVPGDVCGVASDVQIGGQDSGGHVVVLTSPV